MRLNYHKAAMNNSQFRNLLATDPASKGSSQDGTTSNPRSSLGSRSRASIHMTPRSVVGRSTSNNAFVRQVQEHTAARDGEPPAKRFKTVAVPRGTKLAQGYSDRTSSRREEDEEKDGKIKKLKELEQMVKEEKIDQATFERLREQMGIGGDLSTTHLVKGLDFRLLERARQGEDLNQSEEKKSLETAADEDAGDLDDALEDALQKDVVARDAEAETEGEAEEQESAPQSLTRDEILRRLKESRKQAQQAPPEVALGGRFKKLAPTEKPGKKKYTEIIDGRRREVLVITKPDGSTKRKTRWLDPEPAANQVQKPLGMEVPAELLAKQNALEAQEAEDEDDDIFQGVGADYDPLAGIESDAEEDEVSQPRKEEEASKPSGARNYFGSNHAENQEHQDVKSIKQDATLMAAFKRAAALRQDEDNPNGDSAKQSNEPPPSDRSKQFLAKLKEAERQDARDMDLGFGDSRYGDDDDDEDGAIYEDDDNNKEGKPKRKRGGKKRKGDKDNVADVLSVIEGRKK